MAKKKWYTEAQLCDAIQWEYEALGWAMGSWTPDSKFREYEIAHRLRPDFLFYSSAGGYHCYDIIEVKISADLEALRQIANYVWVCESHVRNAPKSAWVNANGSKFRFKGHLLARSFDTGIHSLAAQAGVTLWRIKPYDDGGQLRLEYEEELHPHEDSALDQRFLDVLRSGDPLVKEAMDWADKQEVANGQAVH